MKEKLKMRHFVVPACVLLCFGFLAAALAQENDYAKMQAQLLECSPPKFMLVSDVDTDSKTLTGMSTLTRSAPKPAVMAYHMTFKLSDVKITNARRAAVDESDIPMLKGKLVVLYDGKYALSAAYLGLFQEDAIVISVAPEKK